MTNRCLLVTLLLLTFVSVCRGQNQIRCYVWSTAGGLYSEGCGDQFSLTSVDASFCMGTCCTPQVCRGQNQIRCYACSTAGGLYSEGCGDQFSLTSVDASYCMGTCRKIRGYEQAGGRKVLRVIRGCVEQRSEDCQENVDYLGISDADICYCNTELCNAASGRSASHWMVSLAAALVVMFAMRNI